MEGLRFLHGAEGARSSASRLPMSVVRLEELDVMVAEHGSILPLLD